MTKARKSKERSRRKRMWGGGGRWKMSPWDEYIFFNSPETIREFVWKLYLHMSLFGNYY